MGAYLGVGTCPGHYGSTIGTLFYMIILQELGVTNSIFCAGILRGRRSSTVLEDTFVYLPCRVPDSWDNAGLSDKKSENQELKDYVYHSQCLHFKHCDSHLRFGNICPTCLH